MKINASNTAAAVAALRSRHGARALAHAQRHLETMRTPRGRQQWQAIVAALQHGRDNWDETLPSQWSNGRAVVYETATGYEWEAGALRGEAPTLEQAQRCAEEAM